MAEIAYDRRMLCAVSSGMSIYPVVSRSNALVYGVLDGIIRNCEPGTRILSAGGCRKATTFTR